MTNCLIVSKKILHLLNIPCSKAYLRDSLLSHPEKNSLLSISDTLSNYQVESMAIKVDKKKLPQLPLPCVVQVSKPENDYFQVLVSLDKDKVIFFDENGKRNSTSSEDFLNNWTGVVLLVEAGEHAIEPEVQKRQREKITRIGLLAVFSISLLFWAFMALSIDSLYQVGVIFPISYLALKIGGLVVGVFLLWYDVDRANPLLQRFCTGGKRINCNAVLGSSASSFLGTDLNLSALSFSYFLAGLFLLLITSFSRNALILLGYISLASLPIVIFSIYYQAKVLKNWCRFCLLVDLILVLEIMVWALGGLYGEPFDLTLLPAFTALFVTGLLVWIRIKPLLTLKKDLLESKSSLIKFKSQTGLFETLLVRSKKLNNLPVGIGILFKSESAKYQVIKVCNPYCGPCARTHPILEQLYKAGNIDLQILFTPGGGWEDIKTKTIGHFLAIADQEDNEQTHRALDEWYGGNKDYDSFANKYRLNGELYKQEDKISVMRDWCDSERIRYTPTIFVNGYELPSSYNAEDLLHILT